jgi:hypothetical protein
MTQLLQARAFFSGHLEKQGIKIISWINFWTNIEKNNNNCWGEKGQGNYILSFWNII